MLLLKSLRGAKSLWLVIFGGSGEGMPRGIHVSLLELLFLLSVALLGDGAGMFIAPFCSALPMHCPHGEYHIDTLRL